MSIGLNSDLALSERRLHLQSSYLEESRTVAVSVFDGGVMLFQRRYPVHCALGTAEIEQQVQQLHELVSTDIELLFHMAEKVRESDHLPSIRRLGHLFYEKGFYREAVEQLEYAAKADTDDELELELAKAYFKKGDLQKALERAEAAAEKKPAYPDLQLLLAKIYWGLQRFDEARSAFKKAAALNERYWGAYYSQALCLIASMLEVPTHRELPPPIERLKEADQLLRKAERLGGSDLDHERLKLGLEKLRLGADVEEALEILRQARKDETNGKLFDSEFYFKFMFGRLDEDGKTLDYYIETISRVLSENPDYADLHHSLGIAFLLKGWLCFSRATKEFEKAVAINPDYEKAKKKLKLMQNDGRGLLILLRAVLN